MFKRSLIRSLLILGGCVCLAQAAFVQEAFAQTVKRQATQKQATAAQTDSLALKAARAAKALDMAPVAPFRDTLFLISNMGTFSAQERAASITKKIRSVYKDNIFNADSIAVLASENSVEIVCGDVVIMSVTPADAQVAGKERLALASEYRQIISAEVALHEQRNDWRYILQQVALAVLVIVVLWVLIRLTNRLFRHLRRNIAERKGKNIVGVKSKFLNLIDAESATKLLLSAVRVARFLVIILLLYISIPVMFSVFPSTRGLAWKLFGYVWGPVKQIVTGVVGYVPNLITIIVIVLVFRYLIRGLRYFAEELHKGRLRIKGFYPDWARPTFNIIRTLLYAFMFVVIFPYLPGSESMVFKGVSVFLGVIISLGSTSVIGNIVAGLVLTYMRPFKVGDRIRIGEVVGNVVERTPFVTRIRTPKNEEVTVPNSSIMSAQTFNYTHSAQNRGLILHTEVTFGYEVPWRQVHQLLMEAASRTSDVLKEPKPFVLQTALDDFYVTYQINVFTDDADRMPAIYSELNQHIQDTFNEAGVEIMSPYYTAHRDGNHTTIPAEYLPSDYRSPAFGVKVEKDK